MRIISERGHSGAFVSIGWCEFIKNHVQIIASFFALLLEPLTNGNLLYSPPLPSSSHLHPPLPSSCLLPSCEPHLVVYVVYIFQQMNTWQDSTLHVFTVCLASSLVLGMRLTVCHSP